MRIWRKIALLLSCMMALSGFTGCSLFGKLFDRGDSSQSSSVPEQSSSAEEQDEKIVNTYNIAGAIKIAPMENGADAYMSITAPEIAEINEDNAMIIEMLQNMYLVDGFFYYQSAAAWTQSSASVWALAEESGMDPAIMQSAITEAIATIKEQDFSSTTVTLSYKNEMNAILAYLGSLSAKKTLLSVTNDMLGLMDTSFEDVKAYVIENEVGAMTVSQAHTELNAYLAEYTEYADVDALADALLSKPEIGSIVADVTEGQFTAETIIALDLDVEIEKYGDMTVDGLLTMLMAMMGEDDTEDETITLESILSMVEITLQETTLGDVMPNEAWMPLAMCNLMKVTKCDVTIAAESTFGTLNSMRAQVAFVVEMVMGTQVTEYVLNMDISIEFVEEIVAPTNVFCVCNVCQQNNLVDKSVTVRDNGYVLCVSCYEQMTWETCEYCYIRKADACFRTGEYGEGIFCADCAPLLNNMACDYCANRETDINVTWRETEEAFLCDHCYKYTWPSCAACYEHKQDAVYRDDLGDTYCEKCYQNP